MTAEEKTRLLNLDCFTPTIPLDKTLHQSIEDQVKQTPDNIALVCGEESLTYAEMNDQPTH
ncbi:hypothetical protein AT251_17890 [Enterovibrio nigricans]|nr:hypothetical protein AT251_17890 [Enterovibrio nigricans]